MALDTQPHGNLRLMTTNRAAEPVYRAKEDGCAEAPSCLICPRAYSCHDDPAAEYAAMTWERWRRILRLLDKGRSVPEVVKEVGCSERTVHRVRQNGLGKKPRPRKTEREAAETRRMLDELARSSVYRPYRPSGGSGELAGLGRTRPVAGKVRA